MKTEREIRARFYRYKEAYDYEVERRHDHDLPISDWEHRMFWTLNAWAWVLEIEDHKILFVGGPE